MKLKLNGQTQPPSAELMDDSTVVASVNDGLDLIANANYLGARHVITRAEHFNAEFYQLKTGLAGEILQKFSNYRMQLTIRGDWSELTSGAFADFIRECNRGGSIRFESSEQQASL